MAAARLSRPLDQEEMVQLKRLVATEIDIRMLTSSDPARRRVGEDLAKGVIDVVLNRRSSDKWDGTIQGVGDAWAQFSAIRSVQGKWGSVANPNIPVPASVDDFVGNYVSERQAGRPSSVGGAMNYANPHYSSASNLGWINALDGPRIGIGDSIHYYGTAAGYQPTEAVFMASEAWKQLNASNQARVKALEGALKPENKAQLDAFVSTARGADAHGLMTGVTMVGDYVAKEEGRTFGDMLKEKGVNVDAYNAERGLLTKEEREKLTPEEIEKGIKDGKYLRENGEIIEYSRAHIGDESRKVVAAVSEKIDLYKREEVAEGEKAKAEGRTPDPSKAKYTRTVANFTRGVQDAARRRRSGGTRGSSGGSSDDDDSDGAGNPFGNDPMMTLMIALVAAMLGHPDLANQAPGQGQARQPVQQSPSPGVAPTQSRPEETAPSAPAPTQRAGNEQLQRLSSIYYDETPNSAKGFETADASLVEGKIPGVSPMLGSSRSGSVVSIG